MEIKNIIPASNIEVKKEQQSSEDYTDIIEKKIIEGATNDEIANMPEFQQWCHDQGKEPTKRMASKLRNELNEKRDIISQKEKEIKSREEEIKKIEKLHETIFKLEEVLDGARPFLIKTYYTETDYDTTYTDKDGITCYVEHEIEKGFEMVLKNQQAPKLLYQIEKSRYANEHNEPDCSQGTPEILKDGFEIPTIYSRENSFNENQIEQIRKHLNSELEKLKRKII